MNLEMPSAAILSKPQSTTENLILNTVKSLI